MQTNNIPTIKPSIRYLSPKPSAWVQQFNCSHIKPLIICRGPIRFEAMQVFDDIGVNHYGILVSNKDSINYPHALAPELKVLKDVNCIHFIPDYSAATQQERQQHIDDIIAIAHANDYNAIFAGYGFMAEDEMMVAAMEQAGLNFIGPCSDTVRRAGLKDEAKKTALATGVSVTPGISEAANLANVQSQVEVLMAQYPDYRIRLKATNGGGGKGQRILSDASEAPALAREILTEMKCSDDDNVILVELNIETTRHQEIQVIGNGDWCMTLGGRDCSLQMHEQKLLEVSVTVEELEQQIEEAKTANNSDALASLTTDLAILIKMEEEASRFGQATGLDSVSTFECIVDDKNHFFMEMNTRIQVEHRVSELCYSLRFTNPNSNGNITNDGFEVDSLVALMVLLAAHGKSLPKPQRIANHGSAVEARLNATNHALQPHAGGMIEYWSKALDSEIRDDQGICIANPDTGAFMKYYLAGAYDSNIALLLTVGNNRQHSYLELADVLRQTQIRGRDLATNLDFHYGLVHWFIGNHINARPTTAFIQPYLTLVGQLYQQAQLIDMAVISQQIAVVELKNVITRALQKLLSNPHHLAGWLSLKRQSYQSQKPDTSVALLWELYHYLDMDYRPKRPAANMIWKEDDEVLQTLDKQQSIPVLSILPWLAKQTDFYSLQSNSDLSISIPDALKDKAHQQAMSAVLAPPPVASGNEIVAVSGGMYYSRPSPDTDMFIQQGEYFEKGQPLYIIEVMKMFNTVKAPFSGTVTKLHIDTDGTIIKKGQVLLDVEPEEKIDTYQSDTAQQRQVLTQQFINSLTT